MKVIGNIKHMKKETETWQNMLTMVKNVKSVYQELGRLLNNEYEKSGSMLDRMVVSKGIELGKRARKIA